MSSKTDSNKREDGDSSGDEESPEVVSSVQMKSEREKEIRELFAQKQKLRDEAKEKRKQKLEQIKLQKKVKLALLESQRTEEVEEEEDGADKNETDIAVSLGTKPAKGKRMTFDDNEPTGDAANLPTKKAKSLKRIYPKYNIEVETLTRIQDPRAAAALSFKEKRLAKVPRENCASTVLSYREKLLAKGT